MAALPVLEHRQYIAAPNHPLAQQYPPLE